MENLLNQAEIIARFREELFTLVRPGAKLTRIGELVRVESDSEAMVYGSSPDSEIQGQIEYFAKRGQPFEWKVYSWDLPVHLVDHLKRRGFNIGEPEEVMIYDLHQGELRFPKNPNVKVKTVRDLESLAEYAEVEEQSGKDHRLAEISECLITGSSSCFGFVAYIANSPVALARLDTSPKSHFGGCYGGWTAPEYRHRGAYRALVAARAAKAKRLGVRYLLVDALPTSRPILERLGFIRIATTWPCTYHFSQPESRDQATIDRA